MENKKKNIGFIVTMSLVGVLAVVSIIYATLSTTLNINTSDASITPWNIVFDLTGATSSVSDTDNGVVGTLSLANANKDLTISGMKFYKTGTAQTYELLMKNNGVVTADLSSINVTNANAKANVSVYIGAAGGAVGTASTSITPGTSLSGTTLAGGQSIPIKVVIASNYTESEISAAEALSTITISPNWVEHSA